MPKALQIPTLTEYMILKLGRSTRDLGMAEERRTNCVEPGDLRTPSDLLEPRPVRPSVFRSDVEETFKENKMIMIMIKIQETIRYFLILSLLL